MVGRGWPDAIWVGRTSSSATDSGTGDWETGLSTRSWLARFLLEEGKGVAGEVARLLLAD